MKTERYLVSLFLFVISLLGLAYAPIITVFICVLYCILLPKSHSKLIIIPIIINLCLALAILFSSKNFHGGATDFETYYHFYQSILQNINRYGVSGAWVGTYSRFEPLYYILNIIIGVTFGALSEIQFSILMNFICLLFVAISLIKYSSRFNIKNILFVIIFTLFILKTGSLTLFWRQSLAAACIILAITYQNKLRLVWFALSIGFHISSIFVFPISLFCLSQKKPKYYLCFILLVVAIIWPFIGSSILVNIVNIFGLPSNSFFINDNDYPYFTDSIKTILYSIPVLFFYYIQRNERTDPIFFILLFEVFFLISFSSIPHFFRIIYPISTIIIYFQTAYLALKLNNIFFITFFILSLFINFFRLTSSELGYQFPFYSTDVVYYLL
ncbi:EpsG family protein [Providencia rettgeri]